MDRLFDPQSVAIVGASADPKKISGMIADFLSKSGFPGRIYAVNPRYDHIGEWACYPSVEALPETVDVLVVVVPVAAAFDAIEQAAHRRVPFVVLMTGGFGEGRTGEEGEERLERLNALCRESGMRVIGPNTVGMVNFRKRLPLTFADWYGRDTGQRGGVAILTHSGSVGGLIFSTLQLHGVGVDYWIATGNEANLELADFIDHLSGDDALDLIVCFMEGVVDGRRFMAACDKARAAGKRIVVLKAGASPESRRSTVAHTRKLPSDAEIYRAVFRRLGIVEVGSLSELAYVVKLISSLKDRSFGRIGILSASGGACSLIADHVVSAGLELPELPPELQARLNQAIPAYGSSRNPVDLSADVVSRPEILAATLDALRGDTTVDLWLVFGRPIIDRYYAELATFAKESGKGVVVSSSVPLIPAVEEHLRERDVPVLLDPELCLRALARIRSADAAAPGETTDWIALDGQAGSVSPAETVEEGVRVALVDDDDFGAAITFEHAATPDGPVARSIRVLPVKPREVEEALAEIAPPGGFRPDTVAAVARSAAALAEGLTR